MGTCQCGDRFVKCWTQMEVVLIPFDMSQVRDVICVRDRFRGHYIVCMEMRLTLSLGQMVLCAYEMSDLKIKWNFCVCDLQRNLYSRGHAVGFCCTCWLCHCNVKLIDMNYFTHLSNVWYGHDKKHTVLYPLKMPHKTLSFTSHCELVRFPQICPIIA